MIVSLMISFNSETFFPSPVLAVWTSFYDNGKHPKPRDVSLMGEFYTFYICKIPI